MQRIKPTRYGEAARMNRRYRKYLYALLVGLLCIGEYYGYQWAIDRGTDIGAKKIVMGMKVICAQQGYIDAGQWIITCKPKGKRPGI